MAAKLSGAVGFALLALAVFWIGVNLGASLTLLVEKGIFVPVAVPVIVPRAALAAVKKAGAALTPAPAEA